MQITLTQTELNQAMACWLDSQGFDASKYDITVKFTVGRGENAETKADVSLVEKSITRAFGVYPTVMGEIQGSSSESAKTSDTAATALNVTSKSLFESPED